MAGGARGAGTSGASIPPSELAARISSESDLACRAGPGGPVAPNRFGLTLSKADLSTLGNTRSLSSWLERVAERSAMEKGHRLEGPVRVWLEGDPTAEVGLVEVRSFHRAGRRAPWAFLLGDGPVLELTMNRSVLGRSGQADLTVPQETVSLRHALIWWEGGSARVRDLGSETGTFVDGQPVSGTARVPPGGKLRFGTLSYELRLA